MSVQVLHGDNRQVMAGMPDASIDAIVTDPPYELGFMGKKWDASGIAYQVDLWRECLRVLKPGGHLLAFGGTRTYHRMAVAIEDAGFEIRDSIHWVYGSGFPKSLDVSKAIDKAAGAERQVVGTKRGTTADPSTGRKDMPGKAVGVKQIGVDVAVTAPATEEARCWEGWGTALKPAHEPIVLARKSLDGTVAGNVLQHGTGGLNIDACRVGTVVTGHRTNGKANEIYGDLSYTAGERWEGSPSGRWPANVVFDKIAGQAVDRQAGGASRFFTQADWSDDDWPFIYQAKPSKKERNAGLDELPAKREADRVRDDGAGGDNPRNRSNTAKVNHHPTVKPVALMRHLIRLVTPPNGTVLDPFAGSGTTLVAAIHENKNAIGIELQDEYLPIIQGRIKHAEETKAQQPEQATLGFDQ